ncbi:hypothetical protein JCM19240_522 [Vibrio maritimus]|uniref:Uncharacterized protein n=1 Tax=Vibrio maritimus TaxID=990268 RepID=A0A090T6R3_9VIBR|nr:hypothetical protein JCM19240_522 [Vibrio maritimus]
MAECAVERWLAVDMKKTWRHQAPDSVFGLMIDERLIKVFR